MIDLQVYPLESPNSGMVDPNPDSCGYGTYHTVPQDDFLCTPAAFENFKTLHL